MANTEPKLEKYFYARGRRKTAIATMRLFPSKGESIINGKKLSEYYPSIVDQKYVVEPIDMVSSSSKFYFTVKVKGGGTKKQRDAIRLAISRALVDYDIEFKPALKAAGLLTRDDRMVERKKTGLRKARKAPQFSKR